MDYSKFKDVTFNNKNITEITIDNDVKWFKTTFNWGNAVESGSLKILKRISSKTNGVPLGDISVNEPLYIGDVITAFIQVSEGKCVETYDERLPWQISSFVEVNNRQYPTSLSLDNFEIGKGFYNFNTSLLINPIYYFLTYSSDIGYNTARIKRIYSEALAPLDYLNSGDHIYINDILKCEYELKDGYEVVGSVPFQVVVDWNEDIQFQSRLKLVSITYTASQVSSFSITPYLLTRAYCKRIRGSYQLTGHELEPSIPVDGTIEMARQTKTIFYGDGISIENVIAKEHYEILSTNFGTYPDFTPSPTTNITSDTTIYAKIAKKMLNLDIEYTLGIENLTVSVSRAHAYQDTGFEDMTTSGLLVRGDNTLISSTSSQNGVFHLKILCTDLINTKTFTTDNRNYNIISGYPTRDTSITTDTTLNYYLSRKLCSGTFIYTEGNVSLKMTLAKAYDMTGKEKLYYTSATDQAKIDWIVNNYYGDSSAELTITTDPQNSGYFYFYLFQGDYCYISDDVNNPDYETDWDQSDYSTDPSTQIRVSELNWNKENVYSYWTLTYDAKDIGFDTLRFERISSSRESAYIGDLDSGDHIYIDDVLQISYSVKDGYELVQTIPTEQITVEGDLTYHFHTKLKLLTIGYVSVNLREDKILFNASAIRRRGNYQATGYEPQQPSWPVDESKLFVDYRTEEPLTYTIFYGDNIEISKVDGRGGYVIWKANYYDYPTTNITSDTTYQGAFVRDYIAVTIQYSNMIDKLWLNILSDEHKSGSERRFPPTGFEAEYYAEKGITVNGEGLIKVLSSTSSQDGETTFNMYYGDWLETPDYEFDSYYGNIYDYPEDYTQIKKSKTYTYHIARIVIRVDVLFTYGSDSIVLNKQANSDYPPTGHENEVAHSSEAATYGNITVASSYQNGGRESNPGDITIYTYYADFLYSITNTTNSAYNDVTGSIQGLKTIPSDSTHEVTYSDGQWHKYCQVKRYDFRFIINSQESDSYIVHTRIASTYNSYLTGLEAVGHSYSYPVMPTSAQQSSVDQNYNVYYDDVVVYSSKRNSGDSIRVTPDSDGTVILNVREEDVPHYLIGSADAYGQIYGSRNITNVSSFMSVGDKIHLDFSQYGSFSLYFGTTTTSVKYAEVQWEDDHGNTFTDSYYMSQQGYGGGAGGASNITLRAYSQSEDYGTISDNWATVKAYVITTEIVEEFETDQ